MKRFRTQRAGLGAGTAIATTIMILVLMAGCSSSGGGGGSETENQALNDLATIGLVAEQDSIKPEETVTLTAMAYNASGRGIAGVEIVFTVDDPTLGYVTETGTTGADGTTQVTFTARSQTGTIQITAAADSVSSSPKSITIMEQSGDVTLTLAANPADAITVTNTATITATVTEADGQPVENGNTVNFSVENSLYGTVTETATTNAGKASATFIASNQPGVAVINASYGPVTASVSLEIEAVDAGSIQFSAVSANPIALRGTGSQAFSIVTFNVRDINGNPAKDTDVLMTMDSGVQGAEYLEVEDDTPYTHVVSTVDGVAEVTLHSGYEAGVVSITGTITTTEGKTVSATTPVISMGGGVPTDDWLTISTGEVGWNMGGLDCVGIETEMTVWLADRFGNYNVLDGHSVNFDSERGLAVHSTATTSGATGSATTIIRTQIGRGVRDVVPETWEVNLVDNLDADYGAGTGDPLVSGHPRDGVCSVLVYTRGEESFVDGSGDGDVNGQYDGESTYTDTADDPWVDIDDDGLWDSGSETTPLTTATGSNPEEGAYKDWASNNVWDGVNGKWDGDKYIFRQVDFLVTGHPHIRFDRGRFDVPNGGATTVRILVCDRNYNPLATGSTVDIKVDTGEITGGTTKFEYPSSNFYGSKTTTDMDGDGTIDNLDYELAHRGLIEYAITISDTDPDKEEAEIGELTVTVSWTSGDGSCADLNIETSLPGTVN